MTTEVMWTSDKGICGGFGRPFSRTPSNQGQATNGSQSAPANVFSCRCGSGEIAN